MLFLYILLALVAIIAILGFIAPKDFAVERTIDLSVSQQTANDPYFKIDAKGEGSHVAWGFSGSSPFPMNIFLLFMNIDKSVGGDFEQGLANFKAYIEQ